VSINLLEEGIISTIKAITGNDKIRANFTLENPDFISANHNSFLLSDEIALPKINTNSASKVNLARGLADLAAFYLAFHDNKIHHKQSFANSDVQAVFDNLEKFRLIIKGSENFKGAGLNLFKLIENNLENFDPATGFLSLVLLEKSELKSKKIEQFLNVYKKFLNSDIKSKINELQGLTDDQEKFSLVSLELIDLFKNTGEKNQEKSKEGKEQTKETNLEKSQKEDASSNQENVESQNNQLEQKIDAGEASKQESGMGKSFDFINQEAPSDKETEIISNNENNHKIKFIPEYKIYTTKYDQIIKASDLATREELEQLREQFDLKLKKLSNISNRLTAKLKRKLLAKKDITYERNKEEGYLDRKKISQIIIRPFATDNYVTIKENAYQDTVICLLLDNSGSMRGQPIMMSAMACEIIVKILEKFGVKTEILGFTTVDWRGGKSRKLWDSNSKPGNPGRLSDIRHIIYKNANQSFKKSQNNLGLMLKEGILKENIDGEALIWAKKRLDSYSQKRKILMVISDGTPVDDSTNSNNYTDILSDHLHHVISKIEKHSDIEITAIGIGHEVREFYKNSLMIANATDLGDVMIDRLCNLL
jgi:cobaltochelatase CobT